MTKSICPACRLNVEFDESQFEGRKDVDISCPGCKNHLHLCAPPPLVGARRRLNFFEKGIFIIIGLCVFLGMVCVSYQSALNRQVKDRFDAHVDAIISVGRSAGAQQCRAGYEYPTPEVLNAMARRAVGVNDSKYFVEGFEIGWDYPDASR